MASDTRESSGSDRSISDLGVERAARLSKDEAETYFTWANWFQALTADPRGDIRRKYFHVRDLVKEEEDCKACEGWRDQLFQSSPSVRFLADQIKLVGPALLPEHIRCRRCPSLVGTSASTPLSAALSSHSSAPLAIGGGFNLDYGILLCANEMKSKSHLEDTLTHEMVHAWDYLKFKVDQDNMRHQACTEIRAATLSGECRMTKEVWGRGQWRLVMGMQECVKRRAVLSMMGRPQIRAKENDGDRGKAEAERVVGDVWEGCFRDTRPFDELFK